MPLLIAMRVTSLAALAAGLAVVSYADDWHAGLICMCFSSSLGMFADLMTKR